MNTLLELIDRLVFGLPWVQRRYEQEIAAWHSRARLAEMSVTHQPPEIQALIHEYWRHP